MVLAIIFYLSFYYTSLKSYINSQKKPNYLTRFFIIFIITFTCDTSCSYSDFVMSAISSSPDGEPSNLDLVAQREGVPI